MYVKILNVCVYTNLNEIWRSECRNPNLIYPEQIKWNDQILPENLLHLISINICLRNTGVQIPMKISNKLYELLLC